MRKEDMDGTTVHVICRGNNHSRVFHRTDDYATMLRIIGAVKKDLRFDLYHYALMTNHVHFVVRPEKEGSLPLIMQLINHRYARYHKREYGNYGHLWQGRYRRFAINNDNYLLTCGIYVELNPVRAVMVSNADEYPWSSHRFYVHDEPSRLVAPSPAFLALGSTDDERRHAYLELVNMWLTYPVERRRAKKYFKAGATTRYP